MGRVIRIKMIKAIIFDVDGVLLNSFESNLRYFRELLKRFSYPAPTSEDYTNMFHLPTYDVIKVWTKLKDDLKIKEIMAEGDKMELDGSVEMPKNAAKVITELKEKYKLGIVTGRQRDNIFEGELESYRRLFDAIVGYEDTLEHKPSPEPLLLALKKLKLKPEECIYIGDALTDIKAGDAANIKVICYGKSRMDGSIAKAETFEEILQLIENLNF